MALLVLKFKRVMVTALHRHRERMAARGEGVVTLVDNEVGHALGHASS